jgi:biopolymer transport protein ExbD
MQFMPHKKRRAPSVIIVSLIDVLMVVLIFLVVSTTFKQVPAFKIVMPDSKQAQPGASETAPVSVTINNKEPYFYLADRAMPLDQLEAELKKRVASNPNLSVALRPAKEATMEQFYKALDAVKAANVKSMDWQAAPPGSNLPQK